MRGSVSIKAVTHPRYQFVVSHPERLPDGCSVRRKTYFHTRHEAKSFAAERAAQLASHGTRHSHIADEERAAVIRFRAWLEDGHKEISLMDVVNAGIEVKERESYTSTVHQLIEVRLSLAKKKGSSLRHLADLESRLARFSTNFGPRIAADVTSVEIECWLHGLGLSPVSFANYKRVIGSIFSCALKQGKIATNPVMRVEQPKIIRSAPAIITSRQLSLLLKSAAPELRPLLVLQAFCGVRRAESERLSWEHIHLDTASPFIELPSKITKTNRRRTVEIAPNAVAWLLLDAGTSTTPLGLTETVYRRRLRAASKTAGVQWDENLLRHSFGSYRLAQTKNVARVADEMGNSPNVVRAHYQNLVRPEQAEAYWRIMPETEGSSRIIPFSQEAEVLKAS